MLSLHDDVIKWKHFPHNWTFVRGIHRSPVNSPHKGQWCGALVFSLTCTWTNSWVNNREAGDLRCHHARYDVSVIHWKPLRWRHNGHDSVSNHQPHHCLFNRLFRRRSKKTSKLRVTGLCVGNSPGTGEFPAQKASNTENVSIWWRHHVLRFQCCHWWRWLRLWQPLPMTRKLASW